MADSLSRGTRVRPPCPGVAGAGTMDDHRQPGGATIVAILDTVNLRLTVVSGVSLSYCRAMLSRIVLAVDLATGRPLMYNIRETLSV